MADELYIIDANVVIQAATSYYAFEYETGFWEWMSAECSAGVVRSVSLMKDEIEHPQELVDWINNREKDGLFLDVSETAIQKEYSDLADWMVNQDFGPEHIAKFLNGADLWFIAAARVHKATVVTQEVAAGEGTKKTKIPDICAAHGVPCLDTFDLLQRREANFSTRRS